MNLLMYGNDSHNFVIWRRLIGIFASIFACKRPISYWCWQI